MKKSTVKTYLLLLLVLLLSFSLLLTAFACSKTEEETPEETKETSSNFTSLVTNGDFSTFSSDTAQPYSPSSWSTYTTSASVSDDSVAGIIDTGADYDSNRATWDDLANPYGTVTENKVLMIYNKTENVYGYTSTFPGKAGAYYSISFKVRVVNVEGEKGASVRVYSDNGFVEITNIAAANEFATYTIYVQAPSSDATITVRLALGYDDNKVKGYAFFDDVVASKITEKDYTSATASATVAKGSMLYPDGEFNYYSFSTSSGSKTPLSWSWNKGENVAGKAVPTSDLYHGLISTEESVWDTVKSNYGDAPGLPVADSADKYVMAIVKNKSSDAYSPTAGYYSSKNEITIERATLYEISVWVKAIIDESDANKGARVVLKGTDKYESAVINTTDKTDVHGGWAKVTFYVLGNQLRAQEFTIQLWIGNDKANDTLTQGKIFFDKLTIQTVDTAEMSRADIATTYSAKAGEFNEDYISYVKFVDLETEASKLIANENFTTLDENGLPASLDVGPVENVVVNEGDVIAKVITPDDFNNAQTNWKEQFGIDENPLYPSVFDRVLIVNNIIPSAYQVKTKDLFTINKSLSYRISVWIKTIGLDEGKSISLKLIDENDDDVSSFSSVNTATYENDATNNYVEYCFYLTGEMPTSPENADQSHKVRILISNGSGTKYDPTSYQKGAFLIANINMEQITYTEYDSNSSGSYSTSKDFASSSSDDEFDAYGSTVTNGNFNTYDRKKTTFDDNGYVAMKDKDDNENLVGAVASWTNNVDKKYGFTKVEGEWLEDTYEIKKVESGEENDKKTFTAAIQGKTITTINVTATFDKKYESAEDWNKVFVIDEATGKFSWKSDNALSVGDYVVSIKANDEWLATTYDISKVESGENPNAEFTADIVGKTINEIKINGTFDKTYESEKEWSDVFNINAITGVFEWASNNKLAVGEYKVKIKVDEKELSDLIAGIINVNANDDYLAQFGLTKDMIYDQWSAENDEATLAKNVTFGAPNLLMITTRQGVASIKLKNTVVNGETTNDMTKTPALKSPSISLSSNSFYRFRCYGKAIDGAIGQVYVTTTSADTVITSYTVDAGDGWVEYNFFIETGLSSVSAYFEIYYGEKGDGDTAYSGTLLFDSFSYVSITEKEYLKPAADDKRATFNTITFDNASALEEAVSPSGFSASNSSSSNTDEQVSGIIAKNNFKYTTDAGKNILGIYTSVTKEENGATVTEEVLEEGSSLSASYIFSNDGMLNDAEVGDYLLMINNRKKSYQSYYMSSLSLSSDSYYKFSVYVRTAKIAKGQYAKVYVTISDEPMTFEVNTEYDKDGNAIDNKWQLLTFYFKNERDTSVSASIYFQLGENTDEGKMKGYFFIDNVSLSKISEEDYTTATANNEIYEKDEAGKDKLDADGNKILSAASVEYRLTNKVTVLQKEETTDEGDSDGDEEEEEEEGSGLNTTLLWTYITSIAIAVVLIAVIVVWLIRKYRRPKTGTDKKKADYDRKNVKSSEGETKETTSGTRDEYRD